MSKCFLKVEEDGKLLFKFKPKYVTIFKKHRKMGFLSPQAGHSSQVRHYFTIFKGSTGVCRNTHGCERVYNGISWYIQGYSRVYKGIQGYTLVFKDIKLKVTSSIMSRSIKEVHKGIERCTGIQVYTSYYMYQRVYRGTEVIKLSLIHI